MELLQPPHMSDVGVIGLVPDRWNAPWMPRHHVMSRLARYFTVAWLNPACHWRNHFEPCPQDAASGVPAPPGLTVINPGVMLSHVCRPEFLANMLQRRRLNKARKILAQAQCRRIVLYLWRPELEPALDTIGHDLACYHLDDEYSFSDSDEPISEAEARLMARVSQVFIHSPGLMSKKGGINPNTQYVCNGVDYQAYAQPQPEPPDLAEIPHPRIGYVGYIKRQLDLQLVHTLAEKQTEWSFVLVGPINAAHFPDQQNVLESLGHMSNVWLMGARTVPQLPAYMQHMDVCLLPYRVNDYTKYIYPLKMHEYLATGRPVVGSMIRTLQEYADVVQLASEPDGWSRAIADSLTPAANAPALVAHRRSVASKYDWNLLVAQIAHTLCMRLGPDYAERFEKLRLDFDSRVHVRDSTNSGQSCQLSIRQNA